MRAAGKKFLHFVIPESLLEKVDDFRFRERFPSRAAAIIWLIEFAIKQKPKTDLKP